MRSRWHSILLFCLFIYPAGLALHGQQDIRVNDDPSGKLQENPAIAVDTDGSIIIAWSDKRAGISPRIYLSRSTDGGFSWSPNVRASSQAARPTGGMEMGPGLALGRNGTLYLNWADIRRSPTWSMVDVCVASSTDGGQSFGADPRINNDSMAVQHQPAMASAPDGTVYAAWHGFPSSAAGEDQATPVYVARARDDGSGFETQQRIDRYGPAPKGVVLGSCNCCRPWVFTDQANGNVYVAFRIDSANYRDIFLSRSTDRGSTWSTASRVSHGMWLFGACPGSGPSGFARNDTVFVSWMDQRDESPSSAVYVARSTDGGQSFGNDIALGRNANLSSVVMDGSGRVFVVWNGRGEQGNIYCSMSPDGGLDFGAPALVNHQSPSGQNLAPACAAAPNGMVYCTWMDLRNDDGDIYFANLSGLMASASVATHEDAAADAMIMLAPHPATAGADVELRFSRPPASGTIYNQLGQVVHQLAPDELRQYVVFTSPGIYHVAVRCGAAREMRSIVVVR